MPEPRNGVDTPTLLATIKAVGAQPELAQFQFRAMNRWQQGTHSRTRIHSFYGAGGEQMHEREFTFDADHPIMLVERDQAPTPVEFLLHALASCLTAGIGNIAAARSVTLSDVESTIEGDINLQESWLSDRVRNGYRASARPSRSRGCAGREARTDRRAVPQAPAAYDAHQRRARGDRGQRRRSQVPLRPSAPTGRCEQSLAGGPNRQERAMNSTDTIIIGGGQAGLAMSRCLTDRGVEHVILERGRVAERWRSERWDSLRLLTPRWQSRLPGWRYRGPNPDGFMRKAEVVGRISTSTPAPSVPRCTPASR
jgi:hypothetical protein